MSSQFMIMTGTPQARIGLMRKNEPGRNLPRPSYIGALRFLFAAGLCLAFMSGCSHDDGLAHGDEKNRMPTTPAERSDVTSIPGDLITIEGARNTVTRNDNRRYYYASPSEPEETDEESIGWRRELEKDGWKEGEPCTLTLEMCVRLAARHSDEHERWKERIADNRAPLSHEERRLYDRFRASFFIEIAIGPLRESRLSDTVKTAEDVGKNVAEFDGFYRLLEQRVRLSHLAQLRRMVESHVARLNRQKDEMQINSVDVYLDMSAVSGRLNQRLWEIQEKYLEATNAYENSLDHFKTFVLGLPPDLEVTLDDSIIRAVPGFAEASARARPGHQIMAQFDSGADPAQLVEFCRLSLDDLTVVLQDAKSALERVEEQTPEALSEQRQKMCEEIAKSLTMLETQRSDLQAELSRLASKVDEMAGPGAKCAADEQEANDQDVRILLSQLATNLQTCINDASMHCVQASIEMGTYKPFALDWETAVLIARQKRPDLSTSEGGSMAVERAFERRMRRLLRDVKQVQLLFELRRQAAHEAVRSVQLLDLQTDVAFIGGYHVSRDHDNRAMLAFEHLQETQSELEVSWLKSYATNLHLCCELGIMRVDGEGLWIEEPVGALIERELPQRKRRSPEER